MIARSSAGATTAWAHRRRFSMTANDESARPISLAGLPHPRTVTDLVDYGAQHAARPRDSFTVRLPPRGGSCTMLSKLGYLRSISGWPPCEQACACCPRAYSYIVNVPVSSMSSTARSLIGSRSSNGFSDKLVGLSIMIVARSGHGGCRPGVKLDSGGPGLSPVSATDFNNETDRGSFASSLYVCRSG